MTMNKKTAKPKGGKPSLPPSDPPGGSSKVKSK